MEHEFQRVVAEQGADYCQICGKDQRDPSHTTQDFVDSVFSVKALESDRRSAK